MFFALFSIGNFLKLCSYLLVISFVTATSIFTAHSLAFHGWWFTGAKMAAQSQELVALGAKTVVASFSLWQTVGSYLGWFSYSEEKIPYERRIEPSEGLHHSPGGTLSENDAKAYATRPIVDLDEEDIIVVAEDDDEDEPAPSVAQVAPPPHAPDTAAGPIVKPATGLESRPVATTGGKTAEIFSGDLKSAPRSYYKGPDASEFPSWDTHDTSAAGNDDILEFMFTPHDYGSSTSDNTGIRRQQCSLPLPRLYKTKRASGWFTRIVDWFRHELHKLFVSWKTWSLCIPTADSAVDSFNSLLKTIFSFDNFMCFFWAMIQFSSWLTKAGSYWIIGAILVYVLVRLLKIPTFLYWLVGFFLSPPLFFWLFVVIQTVEMLIWCLAVYVLAYLSSLVPFMKFKAFADVEPPISVLVFAVVLKVLCVIKVIVVGLWSFVSSTVDKYYGDSRTPSFFSRWFTIPINTLWWRSGLTRDAQLSKQVQRMVEFDGFLKSNYGKWLKKQGRAMVEHITAQSSGWMLAQGPVTTHNLIDVDGVHDLGILSGKKSYRIYINAAQIYEDEGIPVFFTGNGNICSDVVRLSPGFFVMLNIGEFKADGADKALKKIREALAERKAGPNNRAIAPPPAESTETDDKSTSKKSSKKAADKTTAAATEKKKSAATTAPAAAAGKKSAPKKSAKKEVDSDDVDESSSDEEQH